MLVSMVFCYTQWCADKTTWVMKTLEAKDSEGKKKKEDLQSSSMKSAGPTERLVVRAAILGGKLAAEGTITGRVSSKTAN